MALEVEVGDTAIASGTPSYTQDVTTAFDPKALIIWAGPTDNTTDRIGDSSGGSGGSVMSVGFCDDADNNYCVASRDENNGLGTAECDRISRDDAAIHVWTSWTPTTTRAGSITLETSKFTITWFAGTGTPTSHFHWIVFGGADITGTFVNNFTQPATDSDQTLTIDADVQGITDGTGIGFFVSNMNASTINTTAVNAAMSFGFSHEAGTDKGFCGGFGADDGASTSSCETHIQNTRVFIFYTPTGTGDNGQAYLKSWDTSGDLVLTWSNCDTFQRHFGILLIKGGQWFCGQENVGTSATTKATTGVGFQPLAIFACLGLNTANGNTNTGSMFSVGASDGTTETSVSHNVEDGVGTMHTGYQHSEDHLLVFVDTTASPIDIDTEGQIINSGSLDSDGFTIDYTTHVGTAHLFNYVCMDSDAVTTNTKTFTIDTVIQEADLTKTFTIDTVIQQASLTKTFTIDTVVQEAGLTKTFTIDTVVGEAGVSTETKTFTIDLVVQEQSLTKTFTIDTIIQESSLTKTFTIDMIIQEELTKTFTIDIVIKAESLSKTFTIDLVVADTAPVFVTKTYSMYIPNKTHSNFLNPKTHRVLLRK